MSVILTYTDLMIVATTARRMTVLEITKEASVSEPMRFFDPSMYMYMYMNGTCY